MDLFDGLEPASPLEIGSVPENIKAIGFRAEAKAINWAVVTRAGDSLVLIKTETQKLPATFDEARGLEWCRKRLHQIVDEHHPIVAGVRYPEPSAPKANVTATNERIRIEGIILESLASKGVDVITGALRTIGSIMGSESAKAYLKRDDLRGLQWKGIPEYRKEAIMVAVAALAHKRTGDAHGSKK